MDMRTFISAPPVLLVTGAASGIGAATLAAAHELDTWTVVGWDRSPATDIVSGPAIWDVDITNPQAVSGALRRIEESFGTISGLVHAAGVHERDNPRQPEQLLWDRMLSVNLMGTVTVCAAVAEHMVAQGGGAIVGVTSNAAATPRTDMAAYGASKAAAASYLRSLGLVLAQHGVRCNMVSPGSTLTPMLTSGWDSTTEASRSAQEGLIAGSAEQFRLGIPLQRVAQPADIAAACLWLVSDSSRHVCMHDLRVDGGATLDSR